MVKVIEKYYCDRCRKETDDFYHSELNLMIKRFRRKHLITMWNGDHGRFEPSGLCKACSESFDKWWGDGKEHK